MRVLLLTNFPAPYNVPLYTELAQRNGFEFKILFLAATESNRSWQVDSKRFQFDHEFLRGWHGFAGRRELPVHVNSGVWRRIRTYNPQVIITTGYDALAYWQAALYCRLFNKRFVLWNGTTRLSAGRTRGPVGWLKKFFVSAADGYVAYGTKAAEYLSHLGAQPEKTSLSINTVDMGRFRGMVKAEHAREGFREERDRYPSLLILYSGQLIPRKGVETLLEALAALRDPEIGLIIVGSGPLEQEFRDVSRKDGLDNVYFEGFQPYEDLHRYYALADVCVLPSLEEVWGLVVNEALASGVYVLCSDRAGAAHDLIDEPSNGVLFRPDDADELARVLKETKARIKEIRDRRDAISRRACHDFSIERAADGIVRAAEMAA